MIKVGLDHPAQISCHLPGAFQFQFFVSLLVFLHHSSVWYFYLRSGQWGLPPSHLYTHCGQSSVALFFMITGYLFFSKLLHSKASGIDFGRLYVSRVLRLVPLYLLMLVLLFSIVAILSHGTLNEPLPKLAINASHWIGFTMAAAPDVNNIANTAIIVAGVTWSLTYEWFFYLSLPLLALAVRVPTPLPYLMLATTSVVCLFFWHAESYHLISFLGGIGAAILTRRDGFRRFSETTTASCLVLLLVGCAVTVFPSAHGIMPVVLLSLAFCLIAGGNTLFRVLVNPVSRTLGELAYGIYLLHGITLFVTITFVLGRDDVRNMSPIAYWIMIFKLTPVLVLFSFLAYRLIEQPAMQSTNAATNGLRSRFCRRAAQRHPAVQTLS
jgi:peptidoglycan/LPS O-acetylase OafA/YrhL